MGKTNFVHLLIQIAASLNADSKVIIKLDYEIVKEMEQQNNDSWYCIQTLDKKYSGFIKAKKLRSPNDYRIIIKKFDTNWNIETLIA